MPVYLGLEMLDISKIEIYKVSRKHKTMTKIVISAPIMCTYLKHDIGDDRKTEGTNKFLIKLELKFRDFKVCLKNNVEDIKITVKV